MANTEQSGSRRRLDWPVRIAGAAGGLAGAAIAMLWRPDFFSGGLWLGLLGFVTFTALGIMLGRLAGWYLFRGPRGR
jgi:hypothetical protein